MKLNNKNKSGYVLYSRVSSNNLTESGHGLKRQIKALKRFVKKNGDKYYKK